MRFTKMQGAGNDYVYINGEAENIPDEDKAELARRVSDRHFGIGSDGLIFINPDPNADFEMEMYNADGSRSEMCGNGIRCVAKYVYDHKMTDKTKGLAISSFGRVRFLDLQTSGGLVTRVRVNMGAPELIPASIPVSTQKFGSMDKIVNVPIPVKDRNFYMTCVSMGNPHAVVFLGENESLENFDIEKYGPDFENHPYFPQRTNTEFVHVDSKKSVHMRVWERGTGETLACGTGCCATAVACILNGLTDDEITVNVLGGKIICSWDREENTVYMTGPAETVFEGEIKF
ncbi:diaminopimelate epimerase [Butyrivibrio sp. MC2013]|uniref:diaminopimelate epimerase n=1 Tax=Butyrivibrio sp. MC2013 TaxID=1280686 RepID=UPI000479268F